MSHLLNSYRFGGSGGGTYDADAETWFSAVETADADGFDLTAVNATYTTSHTKDGHNALFLALKNEASLFDTGYGTKPTGYDVWTEIQFLGTIGGGVATITGTLVPMKSTAGNMSNTGFVSGDHLSVGSGFGITGGSNKYIDTSFAIDSTYLNDVHFGVYVTSLTSGWYFLGNKGGTSTTCCHMATYLGKPIYRMNSGSTSPTVSSMVAHHIAQRDSSTTIKSYVNRGSATSASVASSGVVTTTFRVLNVDTNAHVVGTVPIIHIGRKLTDAQQAYLTWCINSWATYFGGNVYTNP